MGRTDSTPLRRAAFVGLAGPAAAAAAALAASGLEVVAYDRSSARLSALLKRGCRAASSPADAAAGADAVVTSLAGPDEVEELYLGKGGLLDAAREGALLIDVSPSTPELARDVHDAAEVSERHAFDAPVLAAPDGAPVAALCGADEAGAAPARRVLGALAPRAVPLGAAGLGQAARLACDAMLAGCMVGLAEGLALGKQAGLAPEALLDAMAGGPADSAALRAWGPGMAGGDWSGSPAAAAFQEALARVLRVAEDEAVSLPGVETASQLYRLVADAGGGRLGIQALGLAYEDEETCSRAGLDWSAVDGSDEARGA